MIPDMIQTNLVQTRTIKPVRIMAQEGIYDIEKQAVMDGIYNVLQLTGTGGNGIVYLRYWKTEEHKNADGSLKPYQSIDWYLEQGRIASERKGMLNADVLLTALSERALRDNGSSHSWRRRKPYEILVTSEEIYCKFKGDTIFINGLARPEAAAVISACTSRCGEQKDAYSRVRSVAMHEMSHVLGLIPENRTEAVKLTFGNKHCTNECVMQSRTSVVQRKTGLLGRVLGQEQRVIYDEFCPLCEEDLREKFWKE